MQGTRGWRIAGSIAIAGMLVSAQHLAAQNPKTPPPATQKPKTPPKPAAKTPAKPPAKAAEPAAKNPPAPPPPKPGLTVRSAYSGSGGQSSDTRLITNGVRQRVELGDGVAVITQCDAKQILQVSDKAKLYVAMPIDAAPAAAPAPKKTGLVDYTTSFNDTGETKDMFGLKARRVTTVVTRTPTPTSCDKKKERVQTDGWYAALPVPLMCTPVQPSAPPVASDCRDEERATKTGEPPAGKPLAYTVTSFGDDGKETGSARMEVKELVVGPVDEALLDAPAGYTKAADAAAFVAAVERAEKEARWGAPKAAGTIRIGVLLPANKSGEDVPIDAVGDELLEALTVAPYEAVPILSATAGEQAAEAKGKEVDYVVSMDLTALKTSAPSKVGGLVRKASGGGSPTELHEAKVEYRLFNAGSTTPRVSKSANAKSGAFTLKRALGLAKFAGRLYFGASTGMVRMMLSQTGGGAAGVGLPTQSTDPSLNAVSMVMNLLGGSSQQPADETSREGTVAGAVHNAASDILKELGAKKK